MTTLKEYKAMIEGATDAPYNIKTTSEDFVSCMVASYHIAPELIRVIELVEEAINATIDNRDDYLDKCNEALSEIRNLRGE